MGKMGFVKSGINYIDKESYFIRLKSNPNAYLHFESESSEDVTYRFNEGVVGAAIWKKKKALAFMKEYDLISRGAEIVNVKDVLGNDDSLN